MKSNHRATEGLEFFDFIQNEGDKLLIKTTLHQKNKHRERYNFPDLIAAYADLAPFVRVNNYGDESIDFANPDAVMALNKALLIHFYGVTNWSVPQGFLCPPIPGRAEYIHHVAEALSINNASAIHCLDIGVGANCIYPIIGVVDYGWTFVGSDVEDASLKNAQHIIDENPDLNNKIELRKQSNQSNIFQGIIRPDDRFDLSICNPPFHRSQAEASAGSSRKSKNLGGHKKNQAPVLNFGGQGNELWCEGGEIQFLQTMIRESVLFKTNCRWFTTLVSKQENLKSAYKNLKSVDAKEVKTIEMQLGNKMSRILAWRF